MGWFPLFLHLFAMGTLAAIVAVPFRGIGAYYFRFHATIALVVVVAAVLLGRPWEGRDRGLLAGMGALLFAAGVLFENGLVRAVKKDLRVDALLIPVTGGVLFVGLSAFAATAHGAMEMLLLSLHLLTGAAVLGTSMVAMTTGHWYLANAALSFDILVRLCRMFVGAAAAKAVLTAVCVATRFAEYRALEEFWLLAMGVRVGAGIVLAMALALMSLSCARRKANQSATGILYVAVVFVLIGETISAYLTLGKGWPI